MERGSPCQVLATKRTSEVQLGLLTCPEASRWQDLAWTYFMSPVPCVQLLISEWIYSVSENESIFNRDSNIQIPWPEEHLLPHLSLQGLWLQLLPSLRQFLCAGERWMLLQKPSKLTLYYDFSNSVEPEHFKTTMSEIFAFKPSRTSVFYPGGPGLHM